ncbi:unnamed protein product [Rotaria magnacalcarata]|uniref:Uncharacterized protein n=3 Tax=Rotaria magnacalcarata TaxID=392030 RepID=A0A815DLU3_9BILA|nr:unnamed protein product [Rotaria magnacalcarata]CAF3937100.1 unnamed protein product [Rotaria magnacalcarata]
MADETRDVFGREQLSVVTRVVAPYLSEFYSIINKNFTYFHASSVTNEPFKSVQQTLNLGKKNCSSSATTIKKWAETKWDSRWTSINSIIQNYKVLIKSLEELEDEGTKRSTDARGPLLALTEPLFVVTIFILDCLLDKIKILSDQLNNIFSFYPIINSILLEMKDRFSKTNMEILCSISLLSPDSPTFLEIEALKAFCVMLQCDIHLLNNEIQVLKPMLKQV